MGIFNVVTTILFVLKVLEVISISYFMVFLPTLIGWALCLILIIITKEFK